MYKLNYIVAFFLYHNYQGMEIVSVSKTFLQALELWPKDINIFGV
jgi:hypothetical protein